MGLGAILSMTSLDDNDDLASVFQPLKTVIDAVSDRLSDIVESQ